LSGAANRLRNLGSGALAGFGFASFPMAAFGSMYWHSGHGGSPATSSLGGPFGPWAFIGFLAFGAGILTRPAKNHRIGKRRSGKRRGEIGIVSDPDDPHGLYVWGLGVGLMLATLVYVVIFICLS
jgi:hypothetical protein